MSILNEDQLKALADFYEFANEPPANPGDMPSRPVEKEYPIGGYAPGNYQCFCVTCKAWFTGDKRAVQCEPCAEKVVEEWAIEQLSAPSKEGTSQESHSLIVDAQNELLSGAYSKIKALEYQLSSMTEELRKARKNVDGLTHWWTEAKAERDAALKDSEEKQVSINSHYERFNEFIEAANHAREGQEKALKLLDQALKERDVAIGSSRTWEKETSTLGAILEGKNLEIAQLKEEVGEYRNMINHLVFEGNVITRGTARRVKQHLAKYKKEEQK